MARQMSRLKNTPPSRTPFARQPHRNPPTCHKCCQKIFVKGSKSEKSQNSGYVYLGCRPPPPAGLRGRKIPPRRAIPARAVARRGAMNTTGAGAARAITTKAIPKIRILASGIRGAGGAIQCQRCRRAIRARKVDKKQAKKQKSQNPADFIPFPRYYPDNKNNSNPRESALFYPFPRYFYDFSISQRKIKYKSNLNYPHLSGKF